MAALVSALLLISGCAAQEVPAEGRREVLPQETESPGPTETPPSTGVEGPEDVGSHVADGQDDGLAAASVLDDITKNPEESWSYHTVAQGDQNLEVRVAGDNLLAVLSSEQGAAITSSAPHLDSPPWGKIAVIDTRDGTELWSRGLEQFDFVRGEAVTLGAVSAEGQLILAFKRDMSNQDWARIFALDPVTGEQVSETTLGQETCSSATACEGDAWSVREPGTPFLVTSRGGGVARLDTGDLGGVPLWSATIPTDDVNRPSFEDGYVAAPVAVDGQWLDWWLDVETGEEPPWFAGPDLEVRYEFVDSVVLRSERGSSGAVEAFDSEGRSLWSGDPGRILTASGAGGEFLFVAELNKEDEFMDSSVALRRLDARTGEDLWPEPYPGPFRRVGGTPEGSVILHDFDNEHSTVLDLATGQEKHRLPGVLGFTDFGGAIALDHDLDRNVLSGWDLRSGVELWSLDTGGHWPELLGNGLYLVDREDGVVSRFS